MHLYSNSSSFVRRASQFNLWTHTVWATVQQYRAALQQSIRHNIIIKSFELRENVREHFLVQHESII